MDEKPFHMPSEVRQAIPMKPGEVEKVDSEYKREGTCSIFIFTEPPASDMLKHLHIGRRRPGRTVLNGYWTISIRTRPNMAVGLILQKLNAQCL